MKQSMDYTLGEILVAAKLQDQTEWGREAILHVHLLMRAVEFMRADDRIYQVQKERVQIEAPKEISPRKKRYTILDKRRQESAALDHAFCTLVAE